MDLNNIDLALDEMMSINGAIAASVIDWESGMTLGMKSIGGFDIEMASAGNSEVLKAKMATMKSLSLHGDIKGYDDNSYGSNSYTKYRRGTS